MASSEAQKKAYVKYNKKKQMYSLVYTPTDMKEGLRLKKYIESTGISCNAYLKELVKRDLDSKGIEYTDTDCKSLIENDLK